MPDVKTAIQVLRFLFKTELDCYTPIFLQQISNYGCKLSTAPTCTPASGSPAAEACYLGTTTAMLWANSGLGP